ncbi:MAG: type II toxin-antitoxin system RelE/ParE family toxin [Acidobacteria bacterium]|nr:type II toxin-antitoxin system RelE/ParE family toxin [Acidobacteriota bacterium]
MKRFTLTPRAKQDVNDIWDYIADDNIEAADRVLGALEEAMFKLAKNPSIGHWREETADKRHMEIFGADENTRVTRVAVRSATEARQRSPTAIEFHAGVAIQSNREERLRKADPVRGTVEAPIEFHETPDHRARLVLGPTDRQRSPLRQTEKPGRLPQLRHDPARLAELVLRGGTRRRLARSRRNAGEKRKSQTGIASDLLSLAV